MRSPLKPGYSPLTVPVPSWVGSPSDEPISLVGGASGVFGATISDMHFDGVENTAVSLREYHDLTIERCTFANVGQGIYLQVCSNVTIRDCAFWNVTRPPDPLGTHAILVNGCDTVTVEDCWAVRQPPADIGDVINFFMTDNGTVRRCMILGDGTNISSSGIIVGDGDNPGGSGGDNLTVEDNVLIDATISAIGTNNTVRRNVVLVRGLVPEVDGKTAGILLDSGNYPLNVIGPSHVEANDVRCYNSSGQLDPHPVDVLADVAVTGRETNPTAPLIDEFSRWDLTGYFGSP